MKPAEVLAQRAAGHLRDELGAEGAIAFDPLTLLAILSAILQAVKLFQECYMSRAQAEAKLRKPGVIGKSVLKRAVDRAFKEHCADRPELMALAPRARMALLLAARSAPDEEITRLCSVLPN